MIYFLQNNTRKTIPFLPLEGISECNRELNEYTWPQKVN